MYRGSNVIVLQLSVLELSGEGNKMAVSVSHETKKQS